MSRSTYPFLPLFPTPDGKEAPLFEKIHPSGKIECTICGTTGYPGGLWMENCKSGHTDPCPDCGRVLPTDKGMKAHRRIAHHSS